MDDLVSTQWLEEHLDAADIAVIDASSHLPMAKRDARAEFSTAHIPGAHFLDLATLFDPESPVPSAIPTQDQFAQRLSDLGLGDARRFVIYDDSDVRTAARAWFIFRRHGLTDVAILDGGLGKWRAEGRALEEGESRSGGEAAVAVNLRLSGWDVRDKSQMLSNVEDRSELVVDAREAGRFTGELPDFRPEVASGHIPGSINLPFDKVLNDDGTYRRGDELRRVFAGAGVELARPVVTTCGGGVTAAVVLFALHLIGKDDVALYDGSWSEWGIDPETPKELCAATVD